MAAARGYAHRLLVAAAVAATAVAAPAPRTGRLPARYASMDSRPRVSRRQPLHDLRDDGPPPRFVTQRQDHFDGSNPSTWQQAYFVNDTFWVPKSSAPIFLCVGGEGPPLDGSAVSSSVHCNVAVEWLSETKALMFAIEHRYYGCHNASACPVANLSDTGSLRFLSSRQALGDVAAFIEYANQAYGLSPANKWVTWGGSYPGMLAGWARLKFPHLIHASVASSAPVRAELDMRGYNDVVASAYAVDNNGVGGSPACRDAIAAGHKTIGEFFGSPEGRSKLAAAFGETADWYASKDNQANFAGQGVADFPAQANDPACDEPMCNIARICVAMLNASLGDEVQRLSHVRQSQAAARAARPGLLGKPVRETPTPGYNDGEALWPYQTCTEFGFYQTCEVGTGCMFTQGLATLEEEMSFCESQFGIPKEVVSSNIQYSNAYYGSDRPGGSRVLYVNGQVDPWHANSINAPLSPAFPALYVLGASHHAWTHPTLPTDQESVVEVRQAIRWQVAAFLADVGDDHKAARAPPHSVVVV